jgi:hypothetical protein
MMVVWVVVNMVVNLEWEGGPDFQIDQVAS